MSTITTLGPVGFNPTGAYDSTRQYEKLDVVYYQGSSYVAIADSLGQVPTNAQYWDCIALGTLKQFTYDNVASMKLDNSLEDGKVVKTIGYYSANDGGGATYKIRIKNVSDVPDDMTIIQLYDNNLVAELIIENEMNVKQFGATCDGITDDITNVQAIIDSDVNKIIISDNCYVSGLLTVSTTKEISGNGKIIVPSYETLNNPLDVFLINANNCFIHDLEVEANAVDKTPYLNIKAGLSNGYASNRVAFGVTGNNNKFENIITNKVGGFYVIGGTDFYINNCILKLSELGFYIDNANGSVTNVKIEHNSATDSIYYHPFYVPQISSTLNLENIEVDVSGNSTINDVLHIYNANSSTVAGGELIVDNLNVLTNKFATFMQINNSKAYLNRIKATVTTRLISLANNNTVVTVDINDSVLEKTENSESSFVFTSNDHVTVSNSIIKAVNNRLCSDDIEFKNCKLYYTGKFSAGYSGYNLLLEDCYIESAGYTRLIGTSGNFKYINCYFKNTDNTSTTCQYNATTDHIGIIMNCIFENVNAIFTGTYTNVPYSVLYKKISDAKWYSEVNEITASS